MFDTALVMTKAWSFKSKYKIIFDQWVRQNREIAPSDPPPLQQIIQLRSISPQYISVKVGVHTHAMFNKRPSYEVTTILLYVQEVVIHFV